MAAEMGNEENSAEVNRERDENPLLKLKPPETDYITYLMLVENQLTKEKIHTLYDVLSDVKLTVNLGWDLVHLLIPLMPESRPCLERIAELGNPREVLLKVTESLRAIEFEDGEDENENAKDEQAKKIKRDLPFSQFEILTSMLSTLHDRIKTKFPSRFISTTLQGVIAALSKASPVDLIALLPGTISFANSLLLIAKKLPELPPRDAKTGIIAPENTSSTLKELEADPEASKAAPAPADFLISKRLLQSFTTYLTEMFLAPPGTSESELPGLSWSARLFERHHPEKVVPDSQTYIPWVPNNTIAEQRLEIIDSLLELAKTLNIRMEDLIGTFARPVDDSIIEHEAESKDFDCDPPESADDIPLSMVGSLLLYSSKMMPEYLDPESEEQFDMSIFPQHLNILKNSIGTDENGGTSATGTEPEAVIDACLALGILALEHNRMGEPESDVEFDGYLQRMSLLAANTPSSTLRFHAHYITTTVLRSHPSDLTRLSYIRDTLENCPYENLRTVAVGWLKGEIVEANPMGEDTGPTPSEISLFTQPLVLQVLAPSLFPDLTSTLPTAPASDEIIVERWSHFKANVSFYLAVLNFYYLLLAATHIREQLEVTKLHKRFQVEPRFLAPLRETSMVFQHGLDKEGYARILDEIENMQSKETAKSDLVVLDDALARIQKAIDVATS